MCLLVYQKAKLHGFSIKIIILVMFTIIYHGLYQQLFERTWNTPLSPTAKGF